MKKIWYLVCITLWITNTYADGDNTEGNLQSVINKQIGKFQNQMCLGISKLSESINCPGTCARNCADFYNRGVKPSEHVQIYPYSCRPDGSVSAICDVEDGPPYWTIIQRRNVVEPRENFTRPWADYVQGFGQLKGEFWMGLKLIHALSVESIQELYIELEDFEGETRYARYNLFHVGPPEDNYRLTITGYSGDAGDAMAHSNGAPFTTYDRDNDNHPTNCAVVYKGGGWYGECHHFNPNGLPDKAEDTRFGEGINWYQWRGHNYSLKSVTMKIRPLKTH